MTPVRFSIVALSIGIAASAAAQDWHQWRGPYRTGVATWRAPEVWPETLSSRWKVSVGLGHSTPAVVGDVVYQFARAGENELIRALRLHDGETIWESSYRAPYTMDPAATGHGPGPKSSPLVADGKIFTLGIHGIVSAHDTASGERIWQTNTNASPIYGHAMSPMLADGKLIVHVGRSRNGTLSALDPETGRSLWQYEGDGPGYASPILVELDGEHQIVTQTDAHIVGVSLATGKLLWRMPFKTPYDQNVITPIRHERLLIFAGLDARTFAISLAGNEPTEAWSNVLSFYMSTPVLAGNELIGFSDKNSGHFVVLNATTGETTWTGAPRQGDNAALVVTGGESILALTDRAQLSVLESDGSGLEIVRAYPVADSPTWAHPVPTAEGILIKDEDSLTLWSIR